MKPVHQKWLYFVILSLIWGTSFILIKKSLIGLTPYQVGSLRIVFAFIFLMIAGAGRLREIKKPDWKWIAVAGVLSSFLPPFLFSLAQAHIDSSVASILNSVTPLHTFLLGIAFFGLPIAKKQLLGVLVGLAGTLLLIVSGARFKPDQDYTYSLLIILSSLGYAVNINIIKKRLTHLSGLAIGAGNFLCIFFPALLILYFTGFFETLFTSPAMQKALVYVSLLAFFGTALANVLFSSLIQLASPVFSASVTYTMTLVAVLWGLWDGESLTVFQLAGGAAILLGVYLANHNGRGVRRKRIENRE